MAGVLLRVLGKASKGALYLVIGILVTTLAGLVAKTALQGSALHECHATQAALGKRLRRARRRIAALRSARARLEHAVGAQNEAIRVFRLTALADDNKAARRARRYRRPGVRRIDTPVDPAAVNRRVVRRLQALQ